MSSNLAQCDSCLEWVDKKALGSKTECEECLAESQPLAFKEEDVLKRRNFRGKKLVEEEVLEEDLETVVAKKLEQLDETILAQLPTESDTATTHIDGAVITKDFQTPSEDGNQEQASDQAVVQETPLSIDVEKPELDEIIVLKNVQALNVMKEILETERVYNAGLKLLVENYETEFKKNEILTKEEVKTIFANIAVLRRISSQLISAWEAEWNTHGTKPGDVHYSIEEGNQLAFLSVFAKAAPLLRVYLVFFSGQRDVLEEIDRLYRTRKGFPEFCEQVRKLPESKRLHIEDYMLTPFQRLTRYPLLFREMLKANTKETPSNKAQQSVSPQFHHQVIEKITAIEDTLQKLVHEANRIEPEDDVNSIQALMAVKHKLAFTKEVNNLVSPGRWVVGEAVIEVVFEPNATANGAEIRTREMLVIMLNDCVICAEFVNERRAIFKQLSYITEATSIRSESNILCLIDAEFEDNLTFMFKEEHATLMKKWFLEVSKTIEKFVQEGAKRLSSCRGTVSSGNTQKSLEGLQEFASKIRNQGTAKPTGRMGLRAKLAAQKAANNERSQSTNNLDVSGVYGVEKHLPNRGSQNPEVERRSSDNILTSSMGSTGILVEGLFEKREKGGKIFKSFQWKNRYVEMSLTEIKEFKQRGSKANSVMTLTLPMSSKSEKKDNYSILHLTCGHEEMHLRSTDFSLIEDLSDAFLKRKNALSEARQQRRQRNQALKR